MFLFLYFATSVELRSQDKLYPSAMRWIAHQPTLNRTRRRVVGTNASLSMPWDGGNEENNDHFDEAEDSNRLKAENTAAHTIEFIVFIFKFS